MDCVNMEIRSELLPKNYHEFRLGKLVNLLRCVSVSIFIIFIQIDSVKSNDFECGVNRFNNESPLTERIVGGNNSLQ